MTQLSTRRWQQLLTPQQQEKYANAIRQGYFATYDGLRWRHTFYGAYIWKHPGRVKTLNLFRDLLGRAPEWEDLTDDNLRDFREAVTEAYAPNSARTIFAELNAVIRENAATKHIPSVQYGEVLHARRVPTQAVALTDGEVRRIHLYHPRTLTLRHAKRIFMLELLCGARLSDCIRLSADNIAPDGRTITYVSQKSHTVVTVPVHPWLREYLTPFSPREPKTASTATYNAAVRDICRACGIDTPVKVFTAGREKRGHKWEFVTTHTGRRSFATNLALKGVPLEQIALLMGHMNGNVPNIAMTQRYIVGRIGLSPEAFAAFRLPGTDRLAAEQEAYGAPGDTYPDNAPPMAAMSAQGATHAS